MSKNRLSRKEVAQILEDFLEGRGNRWAWDDFTLGMSFEDRRLEENRKRTAGLSKEFPPNKPGAYCNEEGLTVLQRYIQELRGST